MARDTPIKSSHQDDSRIAILLSTYNGGNWLPEQLASLANQTLPFELWWRDDGSSDNTVQLVRAFNLANLRELPHSRAGQNIGPVRSFGCLMAAVREMPNIDWVFFADQDDVWQSNKLEVMLQATDAYSPGTSLLIHHDLRVVNESGVEIAPSFWRYMDLKPDICDLASLLTRNCVTGCATAINRALLRSATPVPNGVIMHDWWLALIAAATGKIEYVEDRLIDYRQHSMNAVGAKGWWHGLNPFTNWVRGWRNGNDEYRSLFPQAHALLEHFENRGSPAQVELNDVRAFCEMPFLPMTQRMQKAKRLALPNRSLLLRLILMLRIATTSIPARLGH